MAPYLYVLITNALGYLLEFAFFKGQFYDSQLSNDIEIINKNFVDVSLL